MVQNWVGEDPCILTVWNHWRKVASNVHMWVVAATEAVVPQSVPEHKHKSRASVLLFCDEGTGNDT